jgi:hypothetical protein
VSPWAAEEIFMLFRLFKNAAMVCVALCASVGAPLTAQEDSLALAEKEPLQTFWIWQVMSKVQPGRIEEDMNRAFSQNLNTSFLFTSGSSTVSPVNVMHTYNRIIFFGSYNTNLPFLQGLGFLSSVPIGGARRTFHEITLGIGYAFVNTPRFRLYPAFALTTTLDQFMFSEKRDSLKLLLEKPLTSRAVTIERLGIIIEFALGADYRFPLASFDFYVMAKVGYNYESRVGGIWDASFGRNSTLDGNWFSRRGVFFQIGVGIGTGRQ